ncbi:hypothetical protein IEO21_10230 [Rhodonia placenta]|uniref:Uncharacterized protein n=1 Tax=Rhodonia placenta TaxID=104341 RepID=A0A8H7NSU7_9APHY|nr:hypothetical protein IEO21_10230 [Postia placenta]
MFVGMENNLLPDPTGQALRRHQQARVRGRRQNDQRDAISTAFQGVDDNAHVSLPADAFGEDNSIVYKAIASVEAVVRTAAKTPSLKRVGFTSSSVTPEFDDATILPNANVSLCKGNAYQDSTSA